MPVNLQPSAGTSGSLRKEKSRGEGTRRMPTNSRPPLSHRIRASFEGKKSQDSTSSKHASFSGGSPTDPELLRRIIDEAISGDVFQAALASHIAKLLKPEIKTALDTIEPVVNAVLQHELLLKRTNNSVDHVLLKLESMADEEGATTPSQARLSIHGALTSHPVADEGPLPIPDNSASGTGTPVSTSNQESRPLFNRGLTYTAGKLTEISDSLDLNNHKLGKVVEGIAEINNLLSSNERLDSLKESSDKNDTKTSVIQTQIDQLQENVRVVITRIGPDLGVKVKAINDHLTGEMPILETRAVASNGSGGDVELLQAISSKLEALKDSLETGTSSHNDNLGLLKEQINALQSTLDAQKEILGEIKEADNSTEILAGIHKSNESHEAHATVLGELKERNTQPVDLSTQPAPTSADAETLQTILTEVQKSNEAHGKHTAALESMKESDTSAAILAEVQKSNDSHVLHAVALESLKSITPPPEQPTAIDLAPFETKMDSLIEASTAILTEVQKSNESHVSHAAALESIKALPTPPSESPTASAIVDLGGLEKDIGTVIEKLDMHAAVLEEIKTKDVSGSGGIDAGAFDSHFGSITTSLEAHTVALDEIKSRDLAPPDFSPIISMLEAHTATLEDIKSRAAGGDPDFSPITALLEAHSATLEDIKSRDLTPVDNAPIISILETHAAILEDIKSKEAGGSPDFSPITTLLEAHTTTLDEIKARDTTNSIDLSPITALLEAHTTTLDEIKSKEAGGSPDFSPITSLLEAHTTTLDEIKSRDPAPTDFSPITTLLEAHTVSLDEIKSKDLPSTDFSPITTLLEAHTIALEDIKAKDTTNSVDLSPITSTLDAHRAVLDEIASKDVQSSVAPAAINMDAFDTHFGSITGILAAHTAALDEIKSKDGTSNASTSAENTIEILDKHFGSITGILAAHTAALDEIKSKDGPSNAPTSAENTIEIIDKHFGSITTMLESHTAALEEIKAKDFTPTTGQMELNTAAFDDKFSSLTRMLDSHTEALDEIKSKNNDSAPPSTSRDNVALDSFEPHVTAIKSALDAHMGVLQEIKSEALAKNDMDAMVVDNLLEPHIIAIKSTLSAHTEILDELKSNILTNTTDSSEIANDSLPKILTTLNRHTNLLTEIKNADVSDEILTALHELQEGNSAAFNTLKESDVSDEILTALHTCNDSQENLDRSLLELQTAVNISISSEQNRNKSIDPVEAVQAPIATVDLSGLETQINAVIATLESQNVVLGEIKHTTNAGIEAHGLHTTTLGEIKDAASASNDSHATHAALLGEIRDAANASNESHGTHTSTLGVIRDAAASLSNAHATQIATLVELKHAISASNESHNTHTSTLAEIRDAAANSNDAILTHTATLSELKEAINASNDSHTSHAAALEDLKSIHPTQSSPDAISESTSPPVLDTSALDTQLTTIITTLESQNSTLGEMKDAHASHTITLSEIKDATTASNESHTSLATVLSEIKDVHSSHTTALTEIKDGTTASNDSHNLHTTILNEIKEATTASNESHTSHTTVLSKIKETIAPIHGIAEVISTHTGLLEGLKEDTGSQHTEVKIDIDGLRKLVDESSTKHEESLLKHGDLIREHGDLVKENHDGLKGTIAGLALGGIAGAGVMKVMDEVEDKDGEVSDVVERDVEVLEASAEELEVIEEESPVLEPEAPVEEDAASESKEQNLEPPVEEQVVPGSEAQLKPEFPTDNERTASEETLVEPELETEAIVTDTEKTVDLNENPDPKSVDQEPEPEPEAVRYYESSLQAHLVEKEVPIEEPTPIEAEAAKQEDVVEEPNITEEEPESATMETTGDTAAIESQQTGKDLSGEETLPQEESEPVATPEDSSELNQEVEISASNDNEEPESLAKEAEIDGVTPNSIEQSGLAQDSPEDEAPQVNDTAEEPIPEESDVTELSKDELAPEEQLAVEKIPGEEETVAVEGSEEEAFGKSERAQVQQNEDLGDEDSKFTEETAPVAVEEEQPAKEIVADNAVEDVSPGEEVLEAVEDKPVEKPVLQESDENLTADLQQTPPAEEEEEKLPEVKESSEPSLEEIPTETPIPEAFIDTPPAHSEDVSSLEANKPVPESEQANVPDSADPPVEIEETPVLTDHDVEAVTQVPEASHGAPADSLEISTESEVIEPSKEEQNVDEEGEIEKFAEEHPVDSNEVNLEKDDLEPKDENLPTEDAERAVDTSKEDKSSDSAAEIETPLLDSNDMNEVPAEIDAKDLETEVAEPKNEETPDHAEENIESAHDQSNPDTPIETEVPISGMNDQDEEPAKTEVKDLAVEDEEPHSEEVPEQAVENLSQIVQEENFSEPVVEKEKSVPDSNSHDQHPIETEQESVEIPATENATEDISSEPTEAIEPPHEEEIPQLPVETEENAPELKTQDEPLIDSEEAPEEHENLEDLTPSVDNKEKTIETDSQESSSEHAPLEAEEIPIEVSHEQSPDLATETEIPAIESSDQTQIPFESKAKSVEPPVSEPEAAGMDSEELQAGNEAQIPEISLQETVQEPVVEDQSPVVPESSGEAQEFTSHHEPLEPAEHRAIEVPMEESVIENQVQFSAEEESVDKAQLKSSPEPEVVNGNVSDGLGSSEEGQIVANDSDKSLPTEKEILDTPLGESVVESEPTSENINHESFENIRDAEQPKEIDEQIAETPSQDSVLESHPKSESVIYEDPEDIKAREEIAALNAEMDRILAEAEEEERRNAPIETEKIHEDQTKEIDVEQDAEESTQVAEAQTPVQDQETSRARIEDEQAQADVTEPEEEQKVPVTDEDLSSDTSPGGNLERHVVSSNDLEEDAIPVESGSHEVESTNILTADELHYLEKIPPATHEDVIESQSQIAEDENVQENHPVIPSEDEKTDLEIPSVAEQPENEIKSNESAPDQAAASSGEEEQVLDMESLPSEAHVEPETESFEKTRLSDDVAPSLDNEEDDSLPIQLESETGIGEFRPEEPEWKGEMNPEHYFGESEQETPRDVMTLGDYPAEDYPAEDYPAKESSLSKLDSINQSTQDEESGVEEIENESPSVEHFEIVGSEPFSEETPRDIDSKLDENAHSVDREVDQENVEDYNELGADLLVPESPQSETTDDNEWDEPYDTPDDRLQGLKPSAEFLSTTSNYGEAPVIEENQHDGESNQDEIASEIPLPSPSVQKKQAILEEDYPAVQNFPEQHESYQSFDDFFPIENEAVRNSSHVSNEDTVEFAEDSREAPVMSDNQHISGNKFATGFEDDLQPEDNESIYSQENEPAITAEHRRLEIDDFFNPRATVSQYVATEQLEPEQESETSPIITRTDSTHKAQSSQPEISAEQRYTGYGYDYDYEEPALNTQTYSDSEDDMGSFQPGPATSSYESRGSYPFQGTSFSRSIPQPRYSSHEEVAHDTRTSFNDQDDIQDLRSMPTYSSPSYSQEYLSESYPTQEVHYNEPEPQRDQPITPTYQSSYQDTIPATPSTALTTKISTETFPTYDESRPVSQGMNFGLPIRGAERVETIRETPEPTYPSYNESMRSPAPSRLPIASQRSSDSMRRSYSPELRKQSSYSRYGHDEPGLGKSMGSSQGFNFGRSPTKIPGSIGRSSRVPDVGNEYGHSTNRYGEPVRSLGASQGSRFGLQGTYPARESHEEVPEYGSQKRSSNVKDLLSRFEGGESSSSAPSQQERFNIPTYQERFSTSLPRPAEHRSIGKQPQYEQESHFEAVTPLDHNRFDFVSEESSPVQTPLEERELQLESGESSEVQTPLEGEFRLDEGMGGNVNAGVPKKRRSKRGKKKGNGGTGGGQA
ncbi:hypothetical protein BELL_0742g00010 [Botrytis elliptica]|uniref:Uncharacterized protein n=1 Tax=Botrytis elliptica TaxID=278938 RepID=A0A4Z1JA43_9HELO|nr:hypothetical protein BELL_0742g00010 [Botrytis elliptica]